jgi:hypothetical protein
MYVFNAETLGVSEYSLAPTGMAEIDGKTVMVEVDGLYENTGTDDAGAEIDAYVQTGRVILGQVSWAKHVARVQLTLAGQDNVNVTLYPVARSGEETLGPYVADVETTGDPHNRLVRVPRGSPGQYWSVKVSNVSGGALDVRSLVLDADQTRVVR